MSAVPGDPNDAYNERISRQQERLLKAQYEALAKLLAALAGLNLKDQVRVLQSVVVMCPAMLYADVMQSWIKANAEKAVLLTIKGEW